MKSPTFSISFVDFCVFVRLLCFIPLVGGAEPFPSVPAGGQRFDPTGKASSPADFPQVQSIRFSVQYPLNVPLQGVKAGVYRVGLVIDSGFPLSAGNAQNPTNPFSAAADFVLAYDGPNGQLLDYGPMEAPADANLKTVLEDPA